MKQPLLIFSPCLAFRVPEKARVAYQFRPLLAPEKARVKQPLLIFSPCLALGTPRMQGLHSNSGLF